MPAEISQIDTMFSARNLVPWHGLGTVLDRVDTWQEAYRLSGIKPANLEPVYALVNGVMREVKDRRAVTVDGIEEPLAIVSDRYRLLDPEQAFDFMDALVSSGNGEYETAGTLRGQRILWLLVRLSESYQVQRGDEVKEYVFLTDHRDGAKAVRAAFVKTRVVCANTHRVAMKEGGISIRHTVTLPEKLKEAQRILGLARETFAKQAEAEQRLAAVKVNREQFEQYLVDVLPTPPVPESPAKLDAWVISRDHVLRDRINVKSLYEGSDFNQAQGSWWGAFSAVTEFVDHYRQPTAARENRLYASFLGVGDEIKTRAFDLALAGAK